MRYGTENEYLGMVAQAGLYKILMYMLYVSPRGSHSNILMTGGGAKRFIYSTEKNPNFRICLPKKNPYVYGIPPKENPTPAVCW